MNYDEEVQKHAGRLFSLEARMNRIEAMIQQLLTILSTSHDSVGQMTQLQLLQQQLQGNPNNYATGPAGFGSAGVTPGAPAQEPPQLQAIRAAMMAGDKIKAIRLYRELYGVDMKTAQDALSRM